MLTSPVAGAHRADVDPGTPRLGFTHDDLDALTRFLEAHGGAIRTIGLEEVYARLPALDPTRARFYASLSDGRHIFIDAKKRLDVSNTAWDVCHLMGHMFQWSLGRPAASMLGVRHFGAAARKMAVADFRGAGPDALEGVIAYEAEANRIAFAILGTGLGTDRQRELRDGFQAHVEQDLTALMAYYSYDWRGPDGEGPQLAGGIGEAVRRAVPSVLEPVALPSAAEFRFRARPILSVPVLHTEEAAA